MAARGGGKGAVEQTAICMLQGLGEPQRWQLPPEGESCSLQPIATCATVHDERQRQAAAGASLGAAGWYP